MDQKVNPADVSASVIGLAFLFALGSSLAEVPIDSAAEAAISEVARRFMGKDAFQHRLLELCGGLQGANKKLDSSIATLSSYMEKLGKLGPAVTAHR